ncbi:ACT domain-containing protein [Methanofollis fontis]|uniref:Acetolactate synthase n=1 Tax=Methanofollis fontis TaxID=2052832 RepID=A0A483CSV0_9EURY|nr:ACT domain-containing protein [Methanofollis fontis]TAJ44185.1 acetolactate synthase [Methanofollis fontis]
MAEKKYIIKQISIFSENKPGRLASIAHALEEAGINILAFSIAEANGFGVVRALVNRPDAAHETLTSMGFMVSFTDVIAVRMRDEPGGLFEIARILGEAGINIEYSYAYSGKEGAVLILRIDRVEEGVRQILQAGGEVLISDLFQ